MASKTRKQHDALPLSHYNKVWAHTIPTAFLFSCKIIRLLTPHKWGHTYHCEIERTEMWAWAFFVTLDGQQDLHENNNV